MRFAPWGGGMLLVVITAFVLPSAGCSKKETPPPADPKVDPKAKADPKAKEDGKKDIAKGKHEGWWCQEHGIPEHICSLCDIDFATKAKKEGDWCKIHDRAQSQCFKCDPSLYKKYEAMYIAKYNKKPEPPPKKEFEK